MIVVNNFEHADSTCIRTVKLPFVDYADSIATEHSVCTFQSCLGNIKDIVIRSAEKSKLITGKILKSTPDLILIYTGAPRIDVLNLCLFLI